MKYLRLFSLVVACLLIVIALTVRLESVPPPWWDEGWTLSVARNWVESGHYGRLLLGQPVPEGLNQAFYVTATIALSFRILGVGIIQARIVGVVITVATLLITYYLAQRIYNRSIALGTLLVMTFMPAYSDLFPIYVGRQVLGEVPAMFFLLAGYVCMLSVPHRPVLAASLAMLSWMIALITKLQVLPFWMCALLIPALIAMYQRNWKSFSSWTAPLIGSLIGSHILLKVWETFLQLKPDFAAPVPGLYEVTAAVYSIPARMFALIVIVLFGIPTLLALIYNSCRLLTDKSPFREHADTVRFSLFVLAGSWFAWFIFFSVGWIRYVFPATFIGSIFVAAMIYELTRGYDAAYTIQKSLAFFNRQSFSKETIGALLVSVIVVTSVPRTAMALYRTYVLDADTSVQQAADFLNSQTEAGALIETYDSELFFLLDRPYHYPPDKIHVELIRRTFLYEDNTVIHYDPLAANPNYLVVGPHSKQWRLYDDVLKTGAFRLLRSYPRYVIYERVR